MFCHTYTHISRVKSSINRIIRALKFLRKQYAHSPLWLKLKVGEGNMESWNLMPMILLIQRPTSATRTHTYIHIHSKRSNRKIISNIARICTSIFVLQQNQHQTLRVSSCKHISFFFFLFFLPVSTSLAKYTHFVFLFVGI